MRDLYGRPSFNNRTIESINFHAIFQKKEKEKKCPVDLNKSLTCTEKDCCQFVGWQCNVVSSSRRERSRIDLFYLIFYLVYSTTLYLGSRYCRSSQFKWSGSGEGQELEHLLKFSLSIFNQGAD